MLMRHLGRLLAPAAWIGLAALAPGLSALADAPAETRTVSVLQAQKDGSLKVTVRGQGDDRVKFTIKNTSKARLNVVIPPGLVASATPGQGGFQSMGLGTPTNQPGRFGAFRNPGQGGDGFRSVPPAVPEPVGIAVSPGQTEEFVLHSVCLNYGVNTPTPRNTFTLMDVEEYTPDVRIRKALRSLATLGTSHMVAQATMWHVANGMTWEQLARNTVKPVNAFELAQAARFVEAVDGSSSSEIVDPAYFRNNRILVRVLGEGPLTKDARRFGSELEGVKVLGLPAHMAQDGTEGFEKAGTILLTVNLVPSKPGQAAAKVTLRHASALGGWDNLGSAGLQSASDLSKMTPEDFAAELDRAVSRAFVTVVPARRSAGMTTMKITNRLPMTIATVTLKAGKAEDTVRTEALGIGPMRHAFVPIPAATATIDRVDLNGL